MSEIIAAAREANIHDFISSLPEVCILVNQLYIHFFTMAHYYTCIFKIHFNHGQKMEILRS